MPRNTETLRNVSLKLPVSLDEKLTRLAQAKGVTRSDILREALAGYEREAEGPSAADLAGDLAGSVSGPRDLSTHRRYLEGFGRRRRDRK